MISPQQQQQHYFFFIFFTLLTVATFTLHLPPQPLKFLKINDTQNDVRSCSYAVKFRTSCSSTTYTRHQISLSFNEAYGNQVYAPRLDDPASRTFERCSSDTLEIAGPCTYQVCYLYLYRCGFVGWKPESVTVYGYYTRSVTFNYNTWIPKGIWYGFNQCNGNDNGTGNGASSASM